MQHRIDLASQGQTVGFCQHTDAIHKDAHVRHAITKTPYTRMNTSRHGHGDKNVPGGGGMPPSIPGGGGIPPSAPAYSAEKENEVRNE